MHSIVDIQTDGQAKSLMCIGISQVEVHGIVSIDKWTQVGHRTSKGMEVHRKSVRRGTCEHCSRGIHGIVQIEIDGKLQVEVHGKGVGRGTWEKGMQRYMGKLQVEVHGEIIGRGTWEKDMQRYMGKLQVEVHGKIIGRGTWENYRQRYMGKLQVEVHGKGYGIATWEKHIYYPWTNVMMI